jgi:hypothetical protein
VNAVSAAITDTAAAGRSRRNASEARRAPRPRTIARGPARRAVDTGIACGAPAASTVQSTAAVPSSQSGSSASAPGMS